MPPRRKTYNEQLRPTPAQVRELERILWRCRARSHTALDQRSTLYRQRGISAASLSPAPPKTRR